MRFFTMLFLLTLLSISCSSFAKNAKEIYAEDYQAAATLQKALKNDDRKTVADLVDYPLEREYPLAAIHSADEFLSNWNDFFDSANTAAVIKGIAEEIGWRGVQIGDGAIWFNNGKIRKLNYRTDAFREKFAAAKTKEALSLHESARGYTRVAVRCETAAKTIRVQEYDADFRYFVWRKDAALSEKPELSLKGEQIFDGSGGNSRYVFKNRDYTYELDSPVLCEDAECNKSLAVFKDDKEISRQICEE